jgi:hypothetical protein
MAAPGMSGTQNGSGSGVTKCSMSAIRHELRGGLPLLSGGPMPMSIATYRRRSSQRYARAVGLNSWR